EARHRRRARPLAGRGPDRADQRRAPAKSRLARIIAQPVDELHHRPLPSAMPMRMATMMVITRSTALVMIAARAHPFECPAFLLFTSATMPRTRPTVWMKKKVMKRDRMNATMPIVLPGKVAGTGGAPWGAGGLADGAPAGGRAAGGWGSVTVVLLRESSELAREGEEKA